jgi:RNA polymerase sigma factor (sigma-70 family)
VRSDKERVYDAYLAASARVGDREAFALLVKRWQPRFLGHAYRLTGDPELAADAAQEAWLEVLHGISRLSDAAAFPAWALRIVSRRCAKLIRGRQRQRATAYSLKNEPTSDGPDESGAQAQSDFAAVEEALACLSSEQQAAIRLHYLEGMDIAQIAMVLDAPAGTVKTRLMHARRKLRKLLEGIGDEKAG